MTNCELGQPGMAVIGFNLSRTKLENLFLAINSCGDHAAKLIANALMLGDCSLKTLNLSYN